MATLSGPAVALLLTTGWQTGQKPDLLQIQGLILCRGVFQAEGRLHPPHELCSQPLGILSDGRRPCSVHPQVCLCHLLGTVSLLLSEFRLLLAQHVPIRFSSSVFHPVRSYSGLADTCFPVEKEPAFGEPDNPVASVLTDMRTTSSTIPENAYVLNKESYYTLDPLRGNYLTVVLERPQKVIRVEVLTGSDERGLYRLQQGQVELGYSLLPHSEGCARYALLGPLVEGHLDQRVFYEEDSVEQLNCIRLLVLASQDSWLLIRQIRVWTQPEEEEEEES